MTNNYLDFAKQLAFRSGDIMLKHFQIGVKNDVKDDNTPVTIADETINKLVIDTVRATFPDHAVLGEEGSSKEQSAEYVWVCDPIDGTMPYTFGVPTSMFSLGLVKNGESILGIVYDPQLKRMYEAVKSKGASLNGAPIRVNQKDTLPGNYVTLPGMQYGLTDTAELLRACVKEKLRTFSYCSVTYESSLVANGQMVGCIFPGNTPWDIAAIKVIVEEAGGKVTDLRGNQQRYDQPIYGAIVSNGFVHDQLVQLVSPHLFPADKLSTAEARAMV